MDWYKINYLILTQISHSSEIVLSYLKMCLFIFFLCAFVSLCGTQGCGTLPGSSRRKQPCKILITPHIVHSWLVKTDSATTILGFLHVSHWELSLSGFAHFLAAGQNAGSAAQMCPRSWQRLKVLLRDTSAALGGRTEAWTLVLEQGRFSIHRRPAAAVQGQKVLGAVLPTAEVSAVIIIRFCATFISQCSEWTQEDPSSSTSLQHQRRSWNGAQLDVLNVFGLFLLLVTQSYCD